MSRRTRTGVGPLRTVELLLVIALAALCPPARAAKDMNAAPNPSFEAGTGAPDGWSLAKGAGWSSGGHAGARCLSGSAQSDPVTVDPVQSYRASAWVRCSSGSGRVVLEVAGPTGAVVARAMSPAVSRSPKWQYTAVELDMPGGATAARLRLVGVGDARFDDAVLAPICRNFALNPTFEADNRGRVGMWSEDTAALMPGDRRGTIGGDKAGRGGSAMALDAPAGAWFASRVVPLPLPNGVRTYRAIGYSRAASGEAGVHVLWIDRAENILRRDVLPTVGRDGDWTRHEATLVAPPATVQASMGAMAAGGRALFDDFLLSPSRPVAQRKPVVRVYVNQVGYELAGTKSAVVGSTFFPRDSISAKVMIVGANGKSVATVPATATRINDASLADWDEYFWRADFAAVRRPGTYRAVAIVGGVRGQSVPFRISKNALITGTGRLGVDFFYVQRCGFAVPGWHAACHMDDAKTPDGKHIDATGGWHSAGDYNKIIYENGDGGCAYAMLKVRDTLPQWFAQFRRDGGQIPDVFTEAEWGARFMTKVVNPATGGMYSDVKQGPGRTWMKWSAPEVHTDNVRGTADDPELQAGEGSSPLVPAVWLRLARDSITAPRNADMESYSRKYWEYLRGKDAGRSSALLMLATLEMDRIAPSPEYREYAREVATNLLKGQVTSGRFRGAWGTGGEVGMGALASYALRYPKDPLVPQIKRAGALWRAFFATTCDNPFGLTKQSVGEKEYFFEPTSTMGTNFVYMQRAWAASLIHRLNNDADALRLATDQFDWILGKNPYDLCQFEGAGSNNPPRYHHRYDAIPGRERGAVPGAIPNGFVRDVTSEDRPGFDMSLPAPGKRHASYRCNEPWLVHNMWYFVALAELRP